MYYLYIDVLFFHVYIQILYTEKFLYDSLSKINREIMKIVRRY